MGVPKKLTEQQMKFANLLVCEEGQAKEKHQRKEKKWILRCR